MNIVVLDSKYWNKAAKNGISKQVVVQTITDAVEDVSKILPNIPKYVNIVISPTTSDDVIPETGEIGMTYNDEYVSITFDFTAPYPIEKLRASLRGTVFHELVHTVTFSHEPWSASVLFGLVTEGLATVFEREYSGAKPLWGQYEDDETMQEWRDEVNSLPESGEKNFDYFFNHPDGRKWIAYKTGTWMVDTLVASGEDLFALMMMSHGEILERFTRTQTVK